MTVFDNHEEFLKLLREIMTYAVDEETTREGGISSDVFFEYLYAPFGEGEVSAITSAIQDADRFTVVVAPFGGGKSTLIHFALRGLDTRSSCYFYYDFKKEIETFYGMDRDSKKQLAYIRDAIKHKISGQFLQDLNTKIAFVFTALRLFFTDRIHERILRWRQKYDHPDLEVGYDGLKELWASDPIAVAEDHDFVMSRLTLSQIITAIKHTLGMSKFLLVFDNVDRLPVDVQSMLLSVTIDLHHAGRGAYGTIVAVREKNIRRYEEAGSHGNVIEFVSLSSYVKERGKPLYLAAPTPSLVDDLLERRYAYALRKASRADHPQLQQSMRLFAGIADHINRGFTSERIYALANHSIRHMLVMNFGFAAYLLRLLSAKVIVEQDGRPLLNAADTNSYLYRFLYASHISARGLILDVISMHVKYHKRALSAPLQCDLDLVILAWLTNNIGQRLLVHDVCSEFESLGENRDNLASSIYRLYDVDMPDRFIELGETETHCSLEEVREGGLRIVPTPLGREFVMSTVTKFEFLHQCLSWPHPSGIDSPEMLSPIRENVSGRIEAVYQFLEIMKDVQVTKLRQIREILGPETRWEEFYRVSFCARGRLVFERIIVSHLRHFKALSPVVFDKWYPKYEGLLRDFYASFDSSRSSADLLRLI